MNTNQLDPDCRRPDGGPYALHREGGHWQLRFEGQQTLFKHELGALYVAYLLLHPQREPLHAVALALKAREACGQPEATDELEQQRRMGLNDAMAHRHGQLSGLVAASTAGAPANSTSASAPAQATAKAAAK